MKLVVLIVAATVEKIKHRSNHRRVLLVEANLALDILLATRSELWPTALVDNLGANRE